MNPTAEDIHHRLDQLRLLASETDDPLAERLVRDLIVELGDMLWAHGALASEEKKTISGKQTAKAEAKRLAASRARKRA